MDALQFKAAWESEGDALYSFSKEQLAGAKLPPQTEAFLTVAGLPMQAAPCLSFRDYSLDWAASEYPWLKSYFPVGSDGAGNPIVIDNGGTVLLLDHDGDFRPIYVNGDVQRLASCLLEYRRLIEEASTVIGKEVFDGEVPEEMLQRLGNEFGRTDPRCVEPGSMWTGELLLDR